MKLQFELHVSIGPAQLPCNGSTGQVTPGACTRCSFRKFRVPGGGPDQLNRCKEAAACSMLTCSSNCSFISWYKTIGFLPPWSCTWVASRVPGLPIRDCARGCNNCVHTRPQMCAIDVTKKILSERLYLVPGMGTFEPWVNGPYAPTTLTVHTTNISRFPCNFFPPIAPHFFGHHDSPSTSPGTLIALRVPGRLSSNPCTARGDWALHPEDLSQTTVHPTQ